MASKLKKLGLNLSIDQALGQDGEASELSLADDTDEFADSFSGKLDLADSEDENGTGRNTLKRDNSSGNLLVPFAIDKSNNSKGSPKYTQRICFEVTNARIIKEGRSKYVAYTAVVINHPGLDRSPAVIDRRYSDFDKLHNLLRKKFQSLMHDVAFPKKMVTGNFKPETIAHRSRAFEQYLTHVYSLEPIRQSSEFADFFYGVDICQAYYNLQHNNYTDAIPLLQKAVHLQRKLLGSTHPHVVATMCAIVAMCYTVEQDKTAHLFAEAALECIGDNLQSIYLVPVLKLSIRLCWKLGKDKKDLEGKLEELRNHGINTDDAPELMQLIGRGLAAQMSF